MSTSKGKKDDSKDPFGGMNVVERLTGGFQGVTTASSMSDAEVVLRANEEREKLRSMKPWQRRKYERDKQRVKLSVRVPMPLSELIDELSETESVSPSSAALWLVTIGLYQWLDGTEQPEPTIPRSIRAKVGLALPEEWEGKRVKRTFDNMQTAKALLDTMTRRYECGISDAFAWALSVGAKAYRNGVRPEREVARDVRHPFKLRIPAYSGKAAARGEEETTPESVLRRFLEEK